jgi:predicted transcriptional regulator YdeE
MIELKKEFNKKGNRHFKQLEKTEQYALYEVTAKNDDATDVYYEIFQMRYHKPDRFHDDEFEVYPSDEDFGVWAWCCNTKERARKKLLNFLKKRLKK